MQPKSFDRSILAILTFAAIGGGTALGFYIDKFGGNFSNITDDLGKWGQTGDFFGGILNPLLSFLSLLALVITLRQTDLALKQNRIALEQSKEELELSRKEMERSADAQTEQVKNIKLQAFEQTYFELLRLHGTIVEQVTFHPRTFIANLSGAPRAAPPSGQDAFAKFSNELQKTLPPPAERLKNGAPTESAIEICNAYFSKNQKSLGHYFRTLYNVIKFVDQGNTDNKKFYSNLLRAQLSSDQLALIFFNAHSIYGFEKMLPLLSKYHLTKHLPQDAVEI